MSAYLATTLLFCVIHHFLQYLKRCVMASTSEDLSAPRAKVPFSQEHIIQDIDGGCYFDPILPEYLVGLYNIRWIRQKLPRGYSTGKVGKLGNVTGESGGGGGSSMSGGGIRTGMGRNGSVYLVSVSRVQFQA